MTPVIERPLTQKQRVLRYLQQGSICVADVPLDLGYAMRNRIGDLRRDGFNIHSELCRVHAHSGPISRYWLKEAPASRLTTTEGPGPQSFHQRAGDRSCSGKHLLSAVVGGAVSDSTPRRLVTAPVQQAIALGV